MFLVYLIKNENKTYIGYTNDFLKRWMQHNSYLKGGAKYTTRNEGLWQPICIIDGFECKKEAMRCEWRLKRARGYIGRIKWINHLLTKEKCFTKNGSDINLLNLNVYVTDEYKKYFLMNTNELSWF
jgi:predicted GIY-YIG superfamily endonuclease|tara:strand:- start:2912 stop:3289 length:378 start_codon:yes stop_codon:yes gene_type:complete